MFLKRFCLVTTILLMLLGVSASRAQGNLPLVDEKDVHFGFSLGLNYIDFAIIPAETDKDVSVAEIIPGFSVGAIADLRLSRYFNFRFTPTLMLNQRNLNYSDSTTTDVLSVPLYLPVYIKYSSERNGNIRPYLIAGGGLWMDWGRNKDKPVLLRTFDTLLEFGVGCDIYFAFFKLAPELKFSFGLNNMLTPLDERDAGALQNPMTIHHTESISKLTTRMLTLTFNFE